MLSGQRRQALGQQRLAVVRHHHGADVWHAANVPPVSASAGPGRTRVCAAVATYNRKVLLAECVAALLAQTHPLDRVFVVDNASTDGTPELLRELGLLDDERVTYECLEQNIGGAGGFARAIDLARATGCDWIWAMDDDAEPPADALALLLGAPAAADPGTAVLAQAVVSPDGGLQLGARGHFRGRPRPLPTEAYATGEAPELDFATLVGILVRGAAARATDPPRAEFFIWGDDYEWCFRLRQHGSIRLVAESRIVHKAVGHGFETRRSRVLNRLPGPSFGATPYAGFWRNICGVRNFVWMKKTYEGQSALGAAGTVGQFALKALLFDERPFARIPWIVRAGIDGRLGVFHTVTPQEWAERLQSERR